MLLCFMPMFLISLVGGLVSDLTAVPLALRVFKLEIYFYFYKISRITV